MDDVFPTMYGMTRQNPNMMTRSKTASSSSSSSSIPKEMEPKEMEPMDRMIHHDKSLPWRQYRHVQRKRDTQRILEWLQAYEGRPAFGVVGTRTYEGDDIDSLTFFPHFHEALTYYQEQRCRGVFHPWTEAEREEVLAKFAEPLRERVRVGMMDGVYACESWSMVLLELDAGTLLPLSDEVVELAKEVHVVCRRRRW